MPIPCPVRGKLTQQNARHRVRWLAGTDRARQAGGHNGGRRQAVIAHHTARRMDHHDHGKSLLLIGQRPDFKPMVERGLAAGELGYIMPGVQKFRRGKRLLRHQGFAVSFSHGALRRSDATISGTGAAVVEIA